MDNREQMHQGEPSQQTEQTQQTEQPQQTVRQPRTRATAIQATATADVIKETRRLDELLVSGKRMPFPGNVRLVNIDAALDITSRIRSAMPAVVREAIAVLGEKEQTEQETARRAQEKLNQATNDAQARRSEAEAAAQAMLSAAQQRAAEIEQQARAAAERLMAQANADAMRMVEESEIVRRANARATEIYDQVQMDIESAYAQAYNDVNLLLSGAAAALNHNAMDLASTRDRLLSSFGSQEPR